MPLVVFSLVAGDCRSPYGIHCLSFTCIQNAGEENRVKQCEVFRL